MPIPCEKYILHVQCRERCTRLDRLKSSPFMISALVAAMRSIRNERIILNPRNLIDSF